MNTKPILSEFCLHPALVEDVVDDLLSSDIISKDNMLKLKNDSCSNLDPNTVMDMRHIQKKENKVKLDRCVENITIKRFTNDKHNSPVNIKCLEMIDKEIAKTKKHLYTFQNQLKKKNDSLMNSICNLEKEEDTHLKRKNDSLMNSICNLEKEEDTHLKRKNDYLISSICNLENEGAMRRSPLIVNLNEDEINHYFNLHLDHLEEAVLKNVPKDHSKIWHPFEIISPPIIKVTTTIKLDDFKQSLNNDGLKIKELPEDIPICVKGKILPVLSSGGIKQKIEERTIVPNNSPDLDLQNSIECKERDTVIEMVKESEIGRHVINTWKYYIRKNKIKLFSEKMKFKIRTGLLKHVLQFWSLYAKHSKEGRQSELNQPLEKSQDYSKKEVVSLDKTLLKDELRKVCPKSLMSVSQKTDAEETIFTTHASNFCNKNLTDRKNSVKYAKADLKCPKSYNVKRLTFGDVEFNKEYKLDSVFKTSTAVGVKTNNNNKVLDLFEKSDVRTTDVKLSKKNTIQTSSNHKKSASVDKPFVKSINFNFPGNLNIDLSPAVDSTNTSVLTDGDLQLNKLTSPITNINCAPKPYSKPMVSHRILTADGVGLDNATTRKATLASNTKVAADINPKLLSQKSVQIKPQGPLANRYAAQEKIIAQQLSIIEKQKQLILDLKAKQLETQSKLSLKSAESQLAQAPVSFSRRLQPVMKTITGDCGHKPTIEEGKKKVNAEIKDKSENLTKSLLERQEYCKQLAEMTRMRKIRSDEERERLKLEEEEKRRQEKKEERKFNILKIKKEKQLALENAKNDLAIKLKTKEMIEKAVSHRTSVLLRNAFRALRQNHFDVKIKTSRCRQLYQTHLLKRVLVCWKEEAEKSIQMNYESAKKHYSTKLMINCWNMWCLLYQENRIKVQVSEDMFMLKLQERMFRRWQEFTAQQYLQTCCKIELAERLHRRQVLRQCFSWWRQLPRLMFVEREREQRRRAWRETVQLLIPDFSPVFAESDQLEV